MYVPLRWHFVPIEEHGKNHQAPRNQLKHNRIVWPVSQLCRISRNRTRRSRKKYFVRRVLRTQLKVTDDYGTCLVKCSCHDRVCASNRRGMDPRLCTCARGCRFSNQRNLPLAYNLGQPHPYLSPCESSQERAILDNASSRKAYQSRSIPRRWTALLNRRNAPPP